MEVDVEDRSIDRLVLRKAKAALQLPSRTDDLAAAILEQQPGDLGQQEIVLDDQDPEAFQQARRQHDLSLLPSPSSPTLGTVVRGGSTCSLERRRASRYDKAMTDLLDQGAAAIACAIQAGRTSGRDGRPVGLQIVAPRLHDRPPLAMAQRAEAALA